MNHNYVIMSGMALQISGVSIVCSAVCSGADQRKYRSSVSLFPAQKARKAENVSIWWRHHDYRRYSANVTITEIKAPELKHIKAHTNG